MLHDLQIASRDERWMQKQNKLTGSYKLELLRGCILENCLQCMTVV